jgi:Cu+-exporting ATPase
MFVDEATATLRLTRGTRTYYFCAPSCLEQFAAPGIHRARLQRELLFAWPLAAAVAALTYLGFPFAGAALVAAALATVVQFYPGLGFYQGTMAAIRARMGNMDILIAVGTSAAYGYSVAVLTFPGRLPPALYFDASSLIIALILTGAYLEQSTRDRAGATLRRLGELLPRTAHRWEGGVESDVHVEQLRIDEVVRVRAGERYPTDGNVRSGRGTSQEAWLTGEPLPVAKAPGDPVLAGAINGESALEVQVTRIGADTLVAQIGQLVAEAETSRVPLQRLADRIAAAFVPLVLVISVVASLGWLTFGGAPAADALLIFVTVVIIACPCAFGIATPAAVVVGTGRAADEGIVFKGHDAMERAATATFVLTDKTGTLTEGRPTLVRVVATSGTSEGTILGWAAGLEAGSSHPLAEAVRRKARADGVLPSPVDAPTDEAGRGVRGIIDGRPMSIRRLDAEDATLGTMEAFEGALRAPNAGELTWSLLVREETPVGLLGFVDTVSMGAAEGVRALLADGVGIAMVTGDREASARHVAAAVGIQTVHAGVSPAEKLAIVRRYQSEGKKVAFVGDGVNDAAALSAADVGIAIGAGADVAKEAGQVVLIRTDFRGAPLALRIARGTVRKVRQNLLWAIGYNAILLPIAAGLLVPFLGFSVYTVLPVAGAAAMAVSSTTVVLNSFSLQWISLGPARPARAA